MSELYIGLMSGTSLDAIDAVLVDFSGELRLVGTHSIPLEPELRSRLTALCQSGPDEIERMGRLDVEMAELFAKAALGALAGTEHTAADICAIGSHGQTIRHRPHAVPGFTLQIGDPNIIAERTGIAVVADFRRRDMAAAGQGAPLVPAFHAAVFSHPERHRIILNLGGIANITVLPANSSAAITGFDTGPANLLMDAWSMACRGRAYDVGGEWATTGEVSAPLLKRLLAHPFLTLHAPKSTGREDFNIEWLRAQLNGLTEPLNDADVQATLLEFTAETVAQAIRKLQLPSGDLFLCGGGAHNVALRQRLSYLLPNWAIASTSALGLAPDWVEATAFAWLARQRMKQQTGNMPAVTGARGERVLGGLYVP
mgnify:FL=1